MNKQSNTYTILYSAVMVVLVGAVLALTYGALKPKQDENIAVDKMNQILSAVELAQTSDDLVRSTFEQYVSEAIIVNTKGETLSTDAAQAFNIELKKELKKDAAERMLPVFICNHPDGTKKYVVPTYGAGLWGPIWGYVALEADGNTVAGAFFAHQGETPGLGAEIEKPKFQSQFKHKALYINGEFKPIEVMKAGQKPTSGAEYVDAISGGTITSKGVQAMLHDCLTDYDNYFRTLHNTQKED